MQAERLITSSGEAMQGPLLLTPSVFGDARGFFFESWNQQRWEQLLLADGQAAWTLVGLGVAAVLLQGTCPAQVQLQIVRQGARGSLQPRQGLGGAPVGVEQHPQRGPGARRGGRQRHGLA